MDNKDEQKLQLLFALIRGARRSDRELSKITGNTRATVTRRRRQLEDENYIKEYTVLPEFNKIGYEIATFVFITWKASPSPLEIKMGKEWLARQPWIVFAAGGEGLATNVVVSLHKNYDDFSKYISALREDCQTLFGDLHFFVINLASKETIFKPFSLSYIVNNAGPMGKQYYHDRPQELEKYKEMLEYKSTKKIVNAQTN